MLDYLTTHPDQSRLFIFFSVLLIMAILEFLLPKRKVNAKRPIRWSSNIGIVVLDSVIARIVLPTTTIAVALYADSQNIGLFNFILQDSWLVIIVSILLLDVLIYGQHIAFHKVQWMWRFHRMHHSDTHIDVTTGIRFHPVEIILSLLIKFAAIIVLGIPALAILLFEIILNTTAMITHSNLNIPLWLDRLLRTVFVTPDMHRVHHSVHRNETDSNYGFNFSFWDRLFNTYIDQPKDTHAQMKIGIKEFREDREQCLDKLLTQPFRVGNTITVNQKRFVKKTNMTIHLHASCWNEEKMLPFFFRHYDSLVDHYFIYDNQSDDKSLEILEAHPRVTVLPLILEGDSFVLAAHQQVNNLWWRSRGNADWVAVCNVDEFFWHQNIGAYLSRCKAEGITFLFATGYQMVADKFPTESANLTEDIRIGARFKKMDKPAFFNPNEITESNFSPGRHKSFPTGNVVYDTTDELLLLHYKYLGLDYVRQRHKDMNERRRPVDIKKGYGRQYDDEKTLQLNDQFVKDSYEIITLEEAEQANQYLQKYGTRCKSN